MIEERKNVNVNTNVVQNIILENREKLSVSGVNDVLSFDDQVVMIDTELGLLTVKGENIKINKLSLDTSEVVVEGEISSLNYSQKSQEKNSVRRDFLNTFLKEASEKRVGEKTKIYPQRYSNGLENQGKSMKSGRI